MLYKTNEQNTRASDFNHRIMILKHSFYNGKAMKTIFPYLTYAGAIPFIVCTVCLSVDIYQMPFLGHIEKILSVYGLVISSFMAGSHWGQHLHMHKELSGLSLAILSNIIAILLWFGFLVLSFSMLMVMLATAFVVLLIIDYRLFKMGLITCHYFRTRCLVSAIVIASLIISGAIS